MKLSFDGVLVFHHCEKKPEKKQLTGEKTYFGSRFQRFQSIIVGRVWQCGH
jgi:hypothetical protein